MSDYFIGLMSGTSLDGVDVALVQMDDSRCELVQSHHVPYPGLLKEDCLALQMDPKTSLAMIASLDQRLAHFYAKAVLELLKKSPVGADQIRAIGSHGQTVFHDPSVHQTIQLGDPNILALETKIRTVADFRRKDCALGGQGAPLVPAFHQAMFQDESCMRVVINIGGIANITVLPSIGSDQMIIGYDTGPGNLLLDAWCMRHRNRPYDSKGQWARTGSLNARLLAHCLMDDYFARSYPKSTGRDDFNLQWLDAILEDPIFKGITPEEVASTLVELTAVSVVRAIQSHKQAGPSNSDLPSLECYLCGGGVHNQFLVERIDQLLVGHPVHSTQKLKVDPDFIEAMAFAWLAKRTVEQQTGSLSTVTGAKCNAVLGGVYHAQ